jgi:hypothetical protein
MSKINLKKSKDFKIKKFKFLRALPSSLGVEKFSGSPT